MNFDIDRIIRPFGEVDNDDTQFIAFVKGNQEIVLVGLFLIGAGFLYLLASPFLNTPPTGTWRYGLCKVFVERITQYPEDLIYLAAEERQGSARIRYLSTNSYGSRVSSQLECFYNRNAQGQIELSRVTMDRKLLRLNNQFPREETKNEGDLSYSDIFNLYDDNQINITRFTYPPTTIEAFNQTIPVIMANADDLDLTLPMNMPTSIKDLKFQ
jgi:hypothetical protein